MDFLLINKFTNLKMDSSLHIVITLIQQMPCSTFEELVQVFVVFRQI
jgi:hypothetical protein